MGASTHLHSSDAYTASCSQDQNSLARLQICSLFQGNMRCAKCHRKPYAAGIAQLIILMQDIDRLLRCFNV